MIDVDAVGKQSDGSILWVHHSKDHRWERVEGKLDPAEAMRLNELREYYETGSGWIFIGHDVANAKSGAGAARATAVTPVALPKLPDDVPPVERYSPSPGILVDRVGPAVKITGIMELSGPWATPQLAASIQQTINDEWTKDFGGGYSINCTVVVRLKGAIEPRGEAIGIETVQKEQNWPSNFDPDLHTVSLNMNDSAPLNGTLSHEFGHVLKLRDRYHESISSRILWGLNPGWRDKQTPPEPGYERNKMARVDGDVEARNVVDMALENKPLLAEERVLNWVKAHTAQEIGTLSTQQKIRIISGLAGGWVVSEDDVAAINRICSSAKTESEAGAIRQVLDLLNL